MQEQVMLSSLVQRHIAQLADDINPAYQETWPEREKINDWEWERLLGVGFSFNKAAGLAAPSSNPPT